MEILLPSVGWSVLLLPLPPQTPPQSGHIPSLQDLPALILECRKKLRLAFASCDLCGSVLYCTLAALVILCIECISNVVHCILRLAMLRVNCIENITLYFESTPLEIFTTLVTTYSTDQIQGTCIMHLCFKLCGIY